MHLDKRLRSVTANTILNAPDGMQRMDIFLTSHKGNIVSDLIKWGTNSFFSHAAATFLLPNCDAGFDHAFVMEAFGRGVEVRNAEKYFGHPENYDFAIVRVKDPWIGGSGDPAENLRKLARGRMLEHIEATYDRWRFLEIAWDVLFRRPAYLIQSYRESRHRDRTALRLHRMQAPRQFVCSTFVSYAFYETARQHGSLEQKPDKYTPSVLFHPDFAHGIPPGMKQSEIVDRVLTTSPADLVRSDLLEWRWMVVNGKAERVTSREEALAFTRKAYGPKINF